MYFKRRVGVDSGYFYVLWLSSPQTLPLKTAVTEILFWAFLNIKYLVLLKNDNNCKRVCLIEWDV